MKFNKVFRLFAVLALLVVFASLPTVAVSAAPQLAPAFQDAPVFPSLEDIFVTLKNSVGIALLGAAILNLCKQRVTGVHMKFNKVFRLFAVLALLVVFASLPTVAVSAAPQLAPAFQDAPVFPSLEDIFVTLKNSVGIALLGAAILNLCKQRGWLHDGDTPTFSLIFQSVGFFSFLLLTLFGKANLIPVVDESAGTIANIINSLVVLAFQLYAARKGHEEVLAGMPGIGTSFSGRKAGEGAMIETVEYREDTAGKTPEEFGEFKA